jgi:hypothetical protein
VALSQWRSYLLALRGKALGAFVSQPSLSPLAVLREVLNKLREEQGHVDDGYCLACDSEPDQALADVQALVDAAQTATLHAARWEHPFPADIDRLRSALARFADVGTADE